MREERGKQIGNSIIGVVISLVVALVFYMAAIQTAGYDTVDALGGTVYSFILAMIISFSVVPGITSRLSRKKVPTSTQSSEQH